MGKSLYRYREVDERTLNGLEKNEFYFTSPKDFNDPFDCKNLFSFDGSNDSDFRQFLKGQIKHIEPHLNQKQINKKVESIIKSGICNDKAVQTKQLEKWREVLEDESNNAGVVCLSERNKDILMWSHYSNKHQGLCIVFDKEILEGQFCCGKVHYSQNYPTFKKFIKILNRSVLTGLFELFLLNKSKHWKYEKEHRLIEVPRSENDLPKKRIINYPATALTGIIWGCQTNEKDKKKVRESLKSKKHEIIYYQASKSKNAYSLKIEKA